MTVLEIEKKSKIASRFLANAGSLKDKALRAMAKAIIENKEKLLYANSIDIENAKNNGMSQAMLDRLTLTYKRIEDMSKGIVDVSNQKDPIGAVVGGETRPNGLKIRKVRVPLGVIGIIFEARPNVTTDAAALCLKSGNSIILRGGKEAINSNKASVEIMRQALESEGLPKDCIQLIENTSHESAKELMQITGYLDVLIPRGGKKLINSVVQNAKVPVIQTGAGNCHMYIDYNADINMAVELVFNAKTSRPSVCNAIETLLVHKDIASEVLPLIKHKLDTKNVELRGCKKTLKILQNEIKLASNEDWDTEYDDLILAVKIVDNVNEAISHIEKYSTGHSECIVSKDYNNIQKFISEVDSAAVYINASTRFTDGGELGLGAEIGISTQKLHARGPMGVEQMTSTKMIIEGNGQIRD